MAVDTKSSEWQMAQNLLFLLHHVRYPSLCCSLFNHCFLTDRASAVYEREDPPAQDRADISFPPPPSPTQPDDSSWIRQPLGQPVADNRSYVSDEAYGGRSGAQDMSIFSPDTYPVTTPISQQFREYSASDAGAQDYAEWRSGSWHERMLISCHFRCLVELD